MQKSIFLQENGYPNIPVRFVVVFTLFGKLYNFVFIVSYIYFKKILASCFYGHSTVGTPLIVWLIVFRRSAVTFKNMSMHEPGNASRFFA